MQLLDRYAGIHFPSSFSWDIEHGDLVLQRIGINVEDSARRGRFALRWDPGDIAVDHKDEVGGFDTVVDAVAEAEKGGVVGGETHVAATSVEDAEAGDAVGDAHEFRDSRMIAPRVAGNDEWLLSIDQGVADGLDGFFREGCGAQGLPVCLIQGIGFNLFFHDFSRSNEVCGACRCTSCVLQCSSYHLLDILPAFEFGRETAVLADNLLLIGYVLNPMDVLGPGARVLAVTCVWGETGEDQDRSSTTGSIVDRCSQPLGSHIHMYNDALRFGGKSSVAISH